MPLSFEYELNEKHEEYVLALKLLLEENSQFFRILATDWEQLFVEWKEDKIVKKFIMNTVTEGISIECYLGYLFENI